jgi:hypothetical protein
MTISITQEALRYIAKLSNFNIDVQARTTMLPGFIEYRAICTQCHEVKEVDRDGNSNGKQRYEGSDSSKDSTATG